MITVDPQVWIYGYIYIIDIWHAKKYVTEITRILYKLFRIWFAKTLYSTSLIFELYFTTHNPSTDKMAQ